MNRLAGIHHWGEESQCERGNTHLPPLRALPGITQGACSALSQPQLPATAWTTVIELRQLVVLPLSGQAITMVNYYLVIVYMLLTVKWASVQKSRLWLKSACRMLACSLNTCLPTLPRCRRLVVVGLITKLFGVTLTMYVFVICVSCVCVCSMTLYTRSSTRPWTMRRRPTLRANARLIWVC